MKRLSRFVFVGLVAGLALVPPAAAIPDDSDPLHPHLGGGDASALPHPGVNHTANMNLVFNSQNPENMTNSDLAFWGNRAYQGDYGGFRIFDISNPAAPRLLGDMRCFGPQNDPVVWENRLVFLAIDRTLTGPNCGATATAAHDNPQGWEGVRIFDVSNPAAIRQIGAVYQDCGAHTITLHPAPAAGVLHLYTSSYPLRPGPTCGELRGPQAGRDPLHGVIQVIEVPLNNPAAAREIAEPRIVYPGDPDNRFTPAEHGLPGPPALERAMRACHDISVFVELNLAAAACAEQSQLWRIRPNGIPDTANPIWVIDDRQDTNGATQNPADTEVAVDFWHSATMTWDGKFVNFIDESFADPTQSNCPPVTPITEPGVAGRSDTGRWFLYNAAGARQSVFMIPRPETAATGCYNSAHLGNVATTIGRYLNVNAWYMGGADVIDFTNPRAPREVAYWDFLPGGMTGSDNWSHYWYENTVGDDNGMWTYGTDGVHNPATGRGFEEFRVTMGGQDIALARLNPQTQESRISCRVTARGASLRTGARRAIQLTVRARGVAVLPGQGFRAHLTLRGAGVSRTVMTNASGNARVIVRPTRRGTIRIRAHSDENLVGCSARRGVFGAAAAGGRLTGSR
jgi:hypothetical protein